MTENDPGDAPSGLPFTPQDALAFMQRMWNPLGVPIPGFRAAGAPGGRRLPPRCPSPIPR